MSVLSGKKVFILVGAALFVLLAVLLGPKPMPVDVGKLGRGPLQITVESEGRTRIKNIYAISAPVAGRLLRSPLKAGDAVEAGKTVLARIDPPIPEFLNSRTLAERKAKVESAVALCELAKAEVTRARAALDFSRAELARNQALVVKRLVAPQVLEQAQLAVRTKEAELAVAEMTRKSREAELEMSRALLMPTKAAVTGSGGGNLIELIAPISGKVLRVLEESEGLVAVGKPLLEIGDPTDLEVLVEMLSENAAKVRVGQEVRILRWGGKTLKGRVRRIEPYGFIKISALGIEEQRVNVLIDFDEPIENWHTMEHGYRVDVQVVIWEHNDVLKIPMGALFRDGNEWAAYRISDHRAQMLPVKIGQSTNQEAEVVSGLSESDQVILHPSDRLRSGDLVMDRLEMENR
ncbi:MAG: HlyD family efflux transporter periplasmic adaptor subunit [Methylococcaceae bacterium]|nr:HlyD family efflux transporter periplasmic adaptor subunit [Methylococcaceae bacterium]